MINGDLTAYLKIFSASIGSGFNEKGKKIFNAEMEMKGKLSAFNCGDLKKTILDKQKAEGYLAIKFNDQFPEIDHIDDNKKYIGDIRLGEENNAVSAVVYITLPCSMFPLLESMGKDTIRVVTIHDLITNPNKDQKTDNVVALVKRIYFEISDDILEEKPRKKFSISIG